MHRVNFIGHHIWMKLLELPLNDFGLRRKSIFIFLVLIIGTRDSDELISNHPTRIEPFICESLIETYSQLYLDGGGILKNVKDFSIDLWRATWVIEVQPKIQWFDHLVQIIRGYGCLVRFLVQICEIDQVYRADAMRKLEENFKDKILRKVFVTVVSQLLYSL